MQPVHFVLVSYYFCVFGKTIFFSAFVGVSQRKNNHIIICLRIKFNLNFIIAALYVWYHTKNIVEKTKKKTI